MIVKDNKRESSNKHNIKNNVHFFYKNIEIKKKKKKQFNQFSFFGLKSIKMFSYMMCSQFRCFRYCKTRL